MMKPVPPPQSAHHDPQTQGAPQVTIRVAASADAAAVAALFWQVRAESVNDVGEPGQTWTRDSTAATTSAIASAIGTPFFCSPVR